MTTHNNIVKSETVKLHVLPTYFSGSFPPEHAGETSVSTVGLNNGNVIKVYLADLEQAELLCNLIVAAPKLLQFAQMIANGGIDASDTATIESEARQLIIEATGSNPFE